MKKQTWVVKNEKGEAVKTLSRDTGKEVDAVYYGTLEEVIQYITLKEFKEMKTLEILNRADDKVNHKPITKQQIEKMLEEEN